LKTQKPEFSPTEKQLQSSLKATDNTTVVLGLSIGGLVFILSRVVLKPSPTSDEDELDIDRLEPKGERDSLGE
jgi:hypothetical protein